MTFRIDADWLGRCAVPLTRATAEHCFDLTQDAGGLARWLLRPEVLDRAAAGWDDRNAAALREAPALRPSAGRAGSCSPSTGRNTPS